MKLWVFCGSQEIMQKRNFVELFNIGYGDRSATWIFTQKLWCIQKMKNGWKHFLLYILIGDCFLIAYVISLFVVGSQALLPTPPSIQMPVPMSAVPPPLMVSRNWSANFGRRRLVRIKLIYFHLVLLHTTW